jgi:hypothetical protein
MKVGFGALAHLFPPQLEEETGVIFFQIEKGIGQ